MKMKKFLALAMALCMVFSMTTAAFAAGVGTEENPEVLTELKGDTITVPGGTNTDGYDGYYYNYIMPDDIEGTVQLSFNVDTASAEKYLLNVDNLTTYDYAQIAPQYDMYSASIKASAGDVIQIKVMAVAKWNEDYTVATYPDLEITWSAEIATVGTATSPEVIESLSGYNGYQYDFSTLVTPNAEGYYYSYEAEVAGTLSFYINEFGCVDEDDSLYVDSYDELKAEVVFTNKTTNKTKKLSEGTTELTLGTGYGAATYNVIQLEVSEGDEIVIQLSSAATGYDDGVMIASGLLLQEPYGASGNPVIVTENNTEVTIPAGQCYYVSIDNYSLQPYPVSVEGGEAVIYDYYGEKMEGQTDLTITETQISMWEYVFMFKIENQSEEDVTYTITFKMPIGISENPEVLDTNDTGEVLFEEGNTDYYFYSWTAPADGIVKFTVNSDADWMYSVTDDDYTIYYGVHSTSKDIKHVVIDVQKGLKLNVQVSAINYDDYVVNKDTTVTTKVEFVESVGTVVDSEEVESIVSDVESGEYDETPVIEIEMGDATVIPAEILNAIKDYNESLVDDYQVDPIAFTIVLKMGDYTWKLTNITGFAPVDLGIDFEASNTDKNVIDKVAEGDDYITFEIGHDGNFGFDGELTFKVDTKYADKTATLYWDNNGTLEKVGTCTVAADGAVKYAFTHASDYVLVFEDTAVVTPPVVNPVPEPVPSTGDMTSVATLLVIAGFAAVVVLSRKKFVQE